MVFFFTCFDSQQTTTTPVRYRERLQALVLTAPSLLNCQSASKARASCLFIQFPYIHPVSGVNKRGKTRATRRRAAVRATPKNNLDFNEKTSLITRPCFHLSGPLCHPEVCLISSFVSDVARNYRLRTLNQPAVVHTDRLLLFVLFYFLLLHSI